MANKGSVYGNIPDIDPHVFTYKWTSPLVINSLKMEELLCVFHPPGGDSSFDPSGGAGGDTHPRSLCAPGYPIEKFLYKSRIFSFMLINGRF